MPRVARRSGKQRGHPIDGLGAAVIARRPSESLLRQAAGGDEGHGTRRSLGIQGDVGRLEVGRPPTTKRFAPSGPMRQSAGTQKGRPEKAIPTVARLRRVSRPRSVFVAPEAHGRPAPAMSARTTTMPPAAIWWQALPARKPSASKLQNSDVGIAVCFRDPRTPRIATAPR